MSSTESFNKEAEELKQGNARSAEIIFDHFAPPIHSFFMGRIGNRETSQDLVQEVFLKVTRHIEQFNSETGTFTAWIWQIARNSAIDYYRQKKSGYLADLPEEGANLLDETARTDGDATMREIMDVVKQLPDEDQELFQMHFVADMAYVEIAKATGKTAPALRVAIHRLKKKIAPLLR
jgi:RNA polymerase sigma-70 factor (ECF subfamily)